MHRELEWLPCGLEQLDAVAGLYDRVVTHLEQHINYPKWSRDYPCRASVREAIEKGGQYACLEQGRVLGAVVLNDDPGGNYEAGDWTRPLARGEYLVIHTLAVDPQAARGGVGGFMVDRCIRLARERGCSAVRVDVVPGNTPAVRLYESRGFTYAGTKDLLRHIDAIPLFELYELNF